MNMGQGGAGIRVLVQCCVECNVYQRTIGTSTNDTSVISSMAPK